MVDASILSIQIPPPLEFQAALTGALGQLLHTAVIDVTTAVKHHFSDALVSGAFAERIVLLAVAVVLMCFSSSLFFTANVGVGAYDTLAFMITQKTKVPMKVTRVITDVSVVLIGLAVSGGLAAVFKGNFSEIKNIGIGTVITAFCTGPLVTFFNKHVSEKILNVNYERVGKDVAYFFIKGALLKNSLRPVTKISDKK